MKEQSDGGVRSAGNLPGRCLRGGHGADCTLAAQPVLHIPAEDGPAHDPGTGRACALAWGFSLRLAGTGAPHRRNLCPLGPCPARVSSQKSCGLHRASVNHAVVSGTRTQVTHGSHMSLYHGSCVARPPSDTGCFQRQRSSYQGTKGPSALCPPPSAPTSRARGPHVCRCVTS